MIPIDKITGRLGNQMFQYAFLYAYAKRNGMDRYYQDPYLFADYEKDIKETFLEGVSNHPSEITAIHVRRGDYVGHDFYVDLMENGYYQLAMNEFPDSKFVVFSDDIAWCKQQGIFKDCEFSHGTEIEDMNNMASCTGHIIANSSFSWWAAFIAPYTRKVVAPSVQNWYRDGIERTVCPSNWVRI